ncbi:MAG: hypothetical protein R3C27_12150 [Hyphomonadaceae bacterium]
MVRVIFEKRDGKYDAMFVERAGALEEDRMSEATADPARHVPLRD